MVLQWSHNHPYPPPHTPFSFSSYHLLILPPPFKSSRTKLISIYKKNTPDKQAVKSQQLLKGERMERRRKKKALPLELS